MSGVGIEYRVLHRLKRLSRVVAKPDANGIWSAVADERGWYLNSVENRRGILGDLLGCETESSSQLRVDFEVRSRAADSVLYSVLDIDDTINLADLCCHAG